MAIERPIIPSNLAIGLGLAFVLCACGNTRRLVAYGGYRGAAAIPRLASKTVDKGWESEAQKAADKTYIERYKALAMRQMKRYKVPASITLAQGIWESASGSSELARLAHNHFGIKCHGWKGPNVTHDDNAKGECFRKYTDAAQSFLDHSLFLKKGRRYKGLFKLRTDDYKGWAYGLKQAGYATDKTYPVRLIKLIEKYDLQRFDQMVLKGEILPEEQAMVLRAKPLREQAMPLQEDRIRETF